MLILTDPLPKTHATTSGDEVVSEGASSSTDSNESSVYGEIGRRYAPISPRWMPRSNRLRVDPTTWHDRHYHQRLRPTAVDWFNWATNSTFQRNRSDYDMGLSGPNPLNSLFMVIYVDTMTFLDAFSKSLDDIMTAFEDETLLMRYNTNWIRILSSGLAELPKVRECIQGFVHTSTPAMPSVSSSQDIQYLSSQATQKLDSTIAKTRSTYDFLRAEFMALESRKQVAESESVTRLTELAFVFIPFSFMASVFSMQIQELQEPVPLAYFFVASICTIAGVYAFRLFIRSGIYRAIAVTVDQTVRAQSSLAEGQPIPTRAALGTAAALFAYPILTHAFVVITLMASVVWLWAARPRLDTTLKAVVTVVVIVCISASRASSMLKPYVGRAARKGRLHFLVPPELRPSLTSSSSSAPSSRSRWSRESARSGPPDV